MLSPILTAEEMIRGRGGKPSMMSGEYSWGTRLGRGRSVMLVVVVRAAIEIYNLPIKIKYAAARSRKGKWREQLLVLRRRKGAGE